MLCWFVVHSPNKSDYNNGINSTPLPINLKVRTIKTLSFSWSPFSLIFLKEGSYISSSSKSFHNYDDVNHHDADGKQLEINNAALLGSRPFLFPQSFSFMAIVDRTEDNTKFKFCWNKKLHILLKPAIFDSLYKFQAILSFQKEMSSASGTSSAADFFLEKVVYNVMFSTSLGWVRWRKLFWY